MEKSIQHLNVYRSMNQFEIFLARNPIVGILSGVFAWASPYITDAFSAHFIDVSTPVIRWIGMMLGVVIALITVYVKINEEIRRQKIYRSLRNKEEKHGTKK